MRTSGPDPGPLGPLPEEVRKLEAVSPPYRRLEPWRWLPEEKLRVATGMILTVDTGVAWDGDSLLGFVGRFKRAYPSVPILGRLEGPSHLSTESSRPHPLVGMRHVRGVLTDDFETAVYREMVNSYSTRTVRTWLLTIRPSAKVEWMGTLMWGAMQVASSKPPAMEDHASLRRHMRALGLPTPHRWVMLRDALRCVLKLQREQCTVEAARTGCYPQTRAFRRHCRLLFDRPPSTLRIWSGWEPLLARFVGLG